MNEDQLIYRVGFEIDGQASLDTLIPPDALSTLVKFNKEIDALKAQQADLNKQLKDGTISQETYDKASERTNITLRKKQDEYKKLRTDVINNEKAQQASLNTYDGLVARNKALSEAMRKLPLSDTTGKLAQLQAEYTKNNDALKKFDASMGNHQRNVGNYPKIMGGITSAMGELPGAVGNASNSFMAFGRALLANPIGIIVAAVGFLINQIMKLNPVMEKLQIITEAVGTAMAYVTDAVYNFITGQEQNQRTLRETIRLQVELTKAVDRHDDALGEFEISQAKANLEFARAIKIARDTTKSIDERIAAVNKAADIEEDRATEEFLRIQRSNKLLEDKLNLTSSTDEQIVELQKQQAAGINALKEAEEKLTSVQKLRNKLLKEIQGEQEEAAERAQEAQQRRNEKLSEEKKLVEELKAAYAALNEEYDKQAQALMTIDSVMMPELKKQIDNNKKILEIERGFQNEMTQQRIQDATRRGDLLKALELRMQQEVNQLTVQFMNAGLSQAEAYAKAKAQIDIKYAREVADTTSQIAKQNENDRIGNMLKIAQAGTSIANSLFQENKKVAISTAIIDTLAAAVNVMRSPGNLFVKLAQSAAILAAGYANVRKMIATQPGSTSGGSSVPTANMGPAMPMGMIGSAFNPSGAMRFGPLTTGAAGSAAPFNARETQGITVYANVDRKGLAIAVREGERQIKTQQFTFAQ
jgi:hypothetical protein